MLEEGVEDYVKNYLTERDLLIDIRRFCTLSG